MSMRDYAVSEKAVFLVDTDVQILIAAAIDGLDGPFEILEEMRLAGIGDACLTTGFDGTATYLASKKSVDFQEDAVLYIQPDRSPDLFSAAYGSLGELADEYRKKLAPLVAIPDDFDYAAHIADIEGTYYG